MNALLNVLICLGFMVYGYLVGSIPTGVIIGKLFFDKDPRLEGSHGSGGTNSSRVLGKKVGVLVIVLDISKTLLVMWSTYGIIAFSGLGAAINLFDGGILYIWLAVLLCAIGHCYPIYIGFKGGKAVACYMGTTGGASYPLFILDFIVFFAVYKIGKKKNVVSYASIISSLTLTFFVWLFSIIAMCGIDISFLSWNLGIGVDFAFGPEAASVTTLVNALLIYRHRENIARLKENKENPYNLFGK